MPLVRVSLLEGKGEAQKRAIADAVHKALVETISIPAQDRFQLVTEHRKPELVYDPKYVDIARSDEIVLIQVVISTGRSLEIKRALFKRMADLLAQDAGLRREDVVINLVEVAKENWSFGNGVAQYAS